MPGLAKPGLESHQSIYAALPKNGFRPLNRSGSKLGDDLPPHLKYLEHVKDAGLRDLLKRSYSQSYAEKEVAAWNPSEVFSFFADIIVPVKSVRYFTALV
jgi:hypothetical protein